MKKIIIAAAALFAITASAQAETYNVEGVTIHVGAGCRSSSCVSVDAPGYGSYHGGRATHARKSHKETTRVAAVKKDDTAATPVAAETTPAAAPVAPAAEPAAAKVPDTTPEAAPLPAASDAAPAK